MTEQPPSFDGGSSSKENFVSLKEYFERRLYDMDRATATAQRTGDIALTKAEEATSQRLLLLNESRDALKDQTRLYVTRVEFDALRDSTQAEIKAILKILYALTGALALVQALVQFFANR